MEKFLSRLVKGIFAMLGFATSCTPGSVPEPMYGPPPPEYGVPSATYRFIGKVSDEDSEGIPGIRVAVKMSTQTSAYVERNGKMVPYVWEHADTLFTDAEGKFAREYDLFGDGDLGYIPENVVITAEDVDGEENGGAFTARKDIKVEVKQVDQGDGHWNMGTYESQADIKLEKE